MGSSHFCGSSISTDTVTNNQTGSLIIPVYDPGLVSVYYVLMVVAPVAVLVNAFSYNILHREKSGFDDVTKMVLKVFTATYAVFAVGEALVSLLQVSHLHKNVKLAVCMHHGPLIYFCLFSTLTLSCLLNINRYIIVLKPLRYHQIVTERRAFLILGVAIGEVILLTVLMSPFPGTPSEEFQKHLCLQNMKGLKRSCYFIFLIAYVVVAVSITIFSTAGLLVISRKQSKAIAAICKATTKTTTISGGPEVSDQSLHGNSASISKADATEEMASTQKRHARNRRAFLTIFLLNIVVIVSWLPLVIYYGLAFCGVAVSPILKSAMMIFIMSSTWWHCLVYIITNKIFREAAIGVLKRFWNKLSN